MNQVFHLMKVVVAVIAGVAAAVCLFVAPQLTVPCAAVSVAFSLMPE